MALFIYLWCLLGIPIAAIRSDLDTGDTLETDEASVREFDLQRRMGLNATGLERFKANLTVHQEKPPTVEELPAVWKDRMKIVKELGSGAFGRIYQLAATCDGTKDHFVSMKFMVKDSDAFREVKALRRMKDSKHVISTVGKPDYLETSDSMYTLTPFMNSGDLLGLMKKCVETDGCRCSKGGIARTCWDKIGGPYSNAYVLTLFYQAVLGVQDMHSKGLVHMDIKLENIMMNCVAGKCSAYIIDLGVSAEFGTRMPSGTPGYMAPEVLKIFGSSQPQNDIFSLGVVLYMFVYGEQPPFFRDGNTRNYDPTKDTIIPQSDNAEQSEIDRLVISMLNNDYKSRIDTPEILQRLMGALLTLPDITPEVIEMLSLTQGYWDLPQCLWDWTPPHHDLADGPVHRDECLEYSSEKMKGPDKGMKICQCPVLRKDKRTVGYFSAPECL